MIRPTPITDLRARAAEIVSQSYAKRIDRDVRAFVDLVGCVAGKHRMPIDRLLSGSHTRQVIAVRFEMWSRLAATLGWTHERIAIVFGVNRRAVDRGIDAFLNRQERIRRVA